jgi:CHASE3 domain sensor protein
MPITSRFVVNFTIVALATGFLALVGIIGTTIWLGERTQSYFEESIRLRDTRLAAIELRSAMQSAESSQRGYLVGSNEIYLAPYDNAKTQAKLRLERLRELMALSGSEVPMLRRLSDLVGEKFDEMDRTIALKNDFRDADAQAIFRTNRGKALMDEANLFLSSSKRWRWPQETAGSTIGSRRRTTIRTR